jgi:hypothetical protein
MLVPQRFEKNPTNGLADDLRPQKGGWPDGLGPPNKAKYFTSQ